MCWAPTSTPSRQQPHATLWLSHQHPVNQESSIFYGGVPWSYGFLRHVRVCVCVCTCMCLKLPTCAPVNKCLKKDRERKVIYIWHQNVQRSPSKILPSSNMPYFFTRSWWFCLEVINLFFIESVSVFDWNNLLIRKSCYGGSNSTWRYFYCQIIRSQGLNPGKSQKCLLCALCFLAATHESLWNFRSGTHLS